MDLLSGKSSLLLIPIVVTAFGALAGIITLVGFIPLSLADHSFFTLNSFLNGFAACGLFCAPVGIYLLMTIGTENPDSSLATLITGLFTLSVIICVPVGFVCAFTGMERMYRTEPEGFWIAGGAFAYAAAFVVAWYQARENRKRDIASQAQEELWEAHEQENAKRREFWERLGTINPDTDTAVLWEMYDRCLQMRSVDPTSERLPKVLALLKTAITQKREPIEEQGP